MLFNENNKKPISLNRSESRSLKLHQSISLKLNQRSLQEWTPQIKQNINYLKNQAKGEPHLLNLQRWEDLVSKGNLNELCQILTGLDRSSIEMREVSPMLGILSDEERLEVLLD